MGTLAGQAALTAFVGKRTRAMTRFIAALAPFLLSVLGLGAASPASAADEVNVSTGATLAGPGLAVHGHDVVAYFRGGGP